MLDLIIRNGRIIDGTGAEPFFADIGIENGKIVFVGNCAAEAKKVIVLILLLQQLIKH